MSTADLPVEPKSDENDPPAADRPVSEVEGNPPPKPGEPRDAAGRAANDPSAPPAAGVTGVVQAPRGKPDGEVDTTA
jgi:hypothetical protein